MSGLFKIAVFAYLVFMPARLPAAYSGGFVVTEEENFALKMRGRIQSRYEYSSEGEGEDLSSFYLRRVRLDLRGHVYDSALSFRIMPKLARTANLRDGWINYRINSKAAVRFGHMSVPFHRQRDVSSTRQHFAEYSGPSAAYQSPGGYDLGLMLHGSFSKTGWKYALGVFDGAGRNVKESHSSGNMASLRIGGPIFGKPSADETSVAAPAQPTLALGLGLQGALKNEMYDWSLGRSQSRRADYAAATADIHFALGRFSGAFDYYLRHVNPEETGNYNSDAYLVTAGLMLIKDRLEAVGRYSETTPDRDDSDRAARQAGLGLNLYHQGHDWKTRINYLVNETSEDTDGVFLVEMHLSF